MGVPTDAETQSHVDFVQKALRSGEIENIELQPNPAVQIKMGFKLAVRTMIHSIPALHFTPQIDSPVQP